MPPFFEASTTKGLSFRIVILSNLDSQYRCGNKHCLWANYNEGVDWGYYSRNNSDCVFCHEKCKTDLNCGAVECGGNINYCSWWKIGKCVTELEQTVTTDEYLTCIKHGG